MRVLISPLIVATLVVAQAAAGTPTVSTPCGVWSGVWVDATGSNGSEDRVGPVARYAGLRYAAEPERWVQSVPLTCDTPLAAVNASVFGPACLQTYPSFAPPQGTAEDCFNYDVYVPSQDAGTRPRPVIVWLYGGGNVVGWSNMYGGLPLLAASTGAVVVAPNFRLGALGFVVLEAAGIGGNRGIGDIVAFLRHIKPVLPALGGDPDAVTVMGQSSGATNALALLGVPDAAGLFSGIVSLSASPNITESAAAASAANAELYLPATGCSDRVCLDAAPGQLLMTKLPAVYGPPPPLPLLPSGSGTAGLVIVDGTVVTKAPMAALASGAHAGLLLNIQTMVGETDPSLAEVDAMPAPSFAAWVASDLAAAGWRNGTGEAVAHLYATGTQPTDGTARGVAETWWTDVAVTCGNNAVAAAGRAGGATVFRTMVVTPPKAPFPQSASTVSLLPFHAWDFPVAGGEMWNQAQQWSPTAPPYVPHERDYALGTLLRTGWRAFAHRANLESELGWSPHACTAVSVDGPAPCPTAPARCAALASLGFSPAFWWVN